MIVTLVVIAHNILFGIACLLIAKRIWMFKRKLAAISEQILGIERAIDRVLNPAPRVIMKAKAGTSQLRDRVQQLGLQYERFQQIVSILSLAQLFLRYGKVLSPRSPKIPVQKIPIQKDNWG